jgi:hypothetical protein
MFAKKAQGVGATNVIIAIVALVVLYILFLPPADRAELLGETPTTVTTSRQTSSQTQTTLPYTGKETLLLEVPGTLDYTALNKVEIPLNSFMLYKTVNAETLEQFNSFYIKKGVGDVTSKNLTFEIPNPSLVNNVMLSFKTPKHQGILTINLNGNTVYQFDVQTTTPGPVMLKQNLLSTTNVLDFSVSGVGWKFWETNEYSFEDVKIIADVSDISRQETMNTFFITEEQGTNIEKARLQFSPNCRMSDVGRLTIRINDRTLFSGVPDCGTLNFVDFAPNMVYVGRNKVDFSTEEGSYIIDLINIKLDLKDNKIPVYYFDVDRSLFNVYYDLPQDKECGRIDGFCPSHCNENNDYDCCMKQYTTPFWCVAATANENDKCVGFVNEQNKDRCPTGYVDKNNRIAEVSKGTCGDNTDGKCPSGCSIHLDKDCCFQQAGDQFWCDTMPINGLEYRCMNSVSLAQCDFCPTGYIGEKRAPICSPATRGYEVEQLKQGYGIIMNIKFTEEYNRKTADIYVNGHLLRLETNSALWQRDISHFIEPGSNSIEIVPFSKLNMRELKIDVVQ